MPRNSQGVMSLPAGNPVVPGTLIESTWANPTMSDIANEITQSLPRNGSAGMTGPLMLARDGQLPKEAVTVNQLNTVANSTNNFLPAGAIQVFAMSAIPTGWLECNGAAISRTTYANLFATIGSTYGAGNGVTTFNLPDLRGEFIRGWDNGRSVDPGRALGSAQGSANQPHSHNIYHEHETFPHTHAVTDPGHNHTTQFSYGANVSTGGLDCDLSGPPANKFQNQVNANTTGISIQSSAANTKGPVPQVSGGEGTEARPRNVAMVYCIKAYGALQQDGLGSMAFQNKETVNITGGYGVFDTLKCNNPPVDPYDVVRLGDIGGTMTDINCDDPQILLVDKTNPNIPVLRPQTNVPFGGVKLNADGKIPNTLMDPSGYNYQGTWDASTGLVPPGQGDGAMYSISIGGTLPLYHEDGIPVDTFCAIGTHIVYVAESTTLPIGWYYEPPPVLGGATASQISFTPVGGISANNVQDGMVELDTEKYAKTGGLISGGVTIAQNGANPYSYGITFTNSGGNPVIAGSVSGANNQLEFNLGSGNFIVSQNGEFYSPITVNPSAASSFTQKNYVDAQVATRQAALGYTPVNKAGDTMTGSLATLDVCSVRRTNPAVRFPAFDIRDTDVRVAYLTYDMTTNMLTLMNERAPNTGVTIGDRITTPYVFLSAPQAGEVNAATRKDYVDAVGSLRVLKSGDSMTGDLQLTGSGAYSPQLKCNVYGGASAAKFVGHEGAGFREALIIVDESTANTHYSMHQNGTGSSPGGWVSTSDRRIKSDVTKIDNALSKLGQLNGYTFHREGADQRTGGVIAQEVLAVIPEGVMSAPLREDQAEMLSRRGENSIDPMLSVDHMPLIGLLIEAVKELKAEVDALKAAR